MKELFDHNDDYTLLGAELEREVLTALQPIMSKYASEGISTRDIELMMHNAVFDVAIECRIDQRTRRVATEHDDSYHIQSSSDEQDALNIQAALDEQDALDDLRERNDIRLVQDPAYDPRREPEDEDPVVVDAADVIHYCTCEGCDIHVEFSGELCHAHRHHEEPLR